ncbi:MAG: hypothetical protein HC833_19900 [Leptolyngbyaceae cyanobacterium RM1_406_9]|nr:hypothetical protein [Leptolyngbyaceae cyanobacterium RM1_406_9]
MKTRLSKFRAAATTAALSVAIAVAAPAEASTLTQKELFLAQYYERWTGFRRRL